MAADPAERRYKDAVRALGVLEGAGHEARLAGGCVRDRLLGHPPLDYDVATTAHPDAVMSAFRAAGFKTVPTGLDHGTVTVVMPNGPVEVTTLRADLVTDGRRATVAFGSSFEEDALRRDFTVNAMFEDRAGVVYDYFGGQADLTAGTLRFVGDPAQRIAEDYLRILRLFRFWSRFGFAPADGTLVQVAVGRGGLAQISQERITSELMKTLAGEHARVALAAMQACGVWGMVLPELDLGPRVDALDALDAGAWAHAAGAAPSFRALGLLALLVRHHAPAVLAPQPLRDLATRLRLSSADARRLAFAGELTPLLAALPRETAAALDFVDACEATGVGAFAGLFTPLARAFGCGDQVAFVESQELAFGFRRVARAPIDGALLQRRLGLAPGPELGRLLALLKRGFRNGAYTSADEGLAWLAAQPSPP